MMAASGAQSARLLLCLLVYVLVGAQGPISDKRLCADKSCEGTISKGRALGRFGGGDSPLYLSFNVGDEIIIKSKSAGNNPLLWGGEVNGQKGYFPSSYVRETRVFVATPQFEIETEGNAFFNAATRPPPPRGRRPPERVQENVGKDESEAPVSTEIESEPSETDQTDLPPPESQEKEHPSETGNVGLQDETEIEEDETDLGEDETDLGEDETELAEEDDVGEGDLDHQTDEQEKVKEKSWERLDDLHYILERGRHDTAEFNSFLKSNLGPSKESEETSQTTATDELKDMKEDHGMGVPPHADSAFVDDQTRNVEVDQLSPKVSEDEQATNIIADQFPPDAFAEDQANYARVDQFPSDEQTNNEAVDQSPPGTFADEQTKNVAMDPPPAVEEGYNVAVDQSSPGETDSHDNSKLPDIPQPEDREDSNRDEPPPSQVSGDKLEFSTEQGASIPKEVKEEESKNQEAVTFSIDDEDRELEEELPVYDPSSVPSGDSYENKAYDGEKVQDPNADEALNKDVMVDKSETEDHRQDNTADGTQVREDKQEEESHGFENQEEIDPMKKLDESSVTDGIADQELKGDENSSEEDVTSGKDHYSTSDSLVNETETYKPLPTEQPFVEDKADEDLDAEKPIVSDAEGREEANMEKVKESDEKPEKPEITQDGSEQMDKPDEFLNKNNPDVVENTDDENKGSELGEDQMEKSEEMERTFDGTEKPNVLEDETKSSMDEGVKDSPSDGAQHKSDDHKENVNVSVDVKGGDLPSDGTQKDETLSPKKDANEGQSDENDTSEDSRSVSMGEQMESSEINQKLDSSMSSVNVDYSTSETPSLADHFMESSSSLNAESPSLEETPSSIINTEKLSKEDGYETVIEDHTTFVYDSNGDVIAINILEVPSTASQQLIPSTSTVASSVNNEQSENLEGVDSSQTISTTSTTQEIMASISSVEDVLSSASQNSSQPESIDSETEGLKPVSETTGGIYQSSDFSSRRMLSLNRQFSKSSGQEPEDLSSIQPTPALEDSQTENPIAREPPSPTERGTPEGVEEERPSDVVGNEKKDTGDGGSLFFFHGEQPHSNREDPGDLLEKALAEEEDDKSTKPSTGVEEKELTTHRPPLVQEENETKPPYPADHLESDPYSTENQFGRKIDDLEGKEQEEEIVHSSPRDPRDYLTPVDHRVKFIIDRLPPSMQSFLEQEPFGLSPTMAVLMMGITLGTLMILTFCSCLCASGKKKKSLKASLDVIQALEAKLQLAIKEKENIEDGIEDNKNENHQLKEEIAKVKRENNKYNQELQTVKLHNKTLNDKVSSLDEELSELRTSATSKHGEIKQQSKKTKELEKQMKHTEEVAAKSQKEAEKLSLELKHKEEEIISLNAKVDGLQEQIGHLETSKEQLLSEAVDWKEKVSDMKERLDQREEDFKQMQETISFKESELDVLKDCFLQLKAFEEESNNGEDTEDNSSRVQEKLKSMMDVSKVNASLHSVEEERDTLANRIQIELEARKELEEQLEASQKTQETSLADKMKAERQCQEAQTKLNVLSSYFKEKEMQLQKELGEHEALKKQNHNKLVSADENTRTVMQEMEVMRTQNESLKRELASSERDFRTQIAANEKKAHENWLAARAAERELKEARHEAGVLRQRLTDFERRQAMGPGGLIRPLPTRAMPPGMINGPPPPPPGMERSPSRGSLPPHLRDEMSPRSDRGMPPPMDRRGPPPGMRPPPPLDARSPPLRFPPHGDARSPPLRMPPPDGRSPPPYDRRPPPPHMMDRQSPPFRLPPPDMMPPPPHLRGGPPPPPHMMRGGSMSPPGDPDYARSDSRQDGRYPGPLYGRNPQMPQDRNSRPSPTSPRQQSQV